MSNYYGTAINPATGKPEDCEFLDDYFGRHKYGVRFDANPTVYPEDQVTVISPEITAHVIRALQHDIHRDNVDAGWWKDPETGEDLREPKHLKKTLGWKFLLAHSEISEAIEGVRRNLKDDKLPHRAMVEVEIADTLIRLLDIAGAMGLDVAGAIEEKRAFNAKRTDHKMENRQSEGGKAF